ncbi:aldo/keto reductase [Epithele typhae]|uniref:aldo/keto reductase n=1 Tax=Epithele typhae TaxID=378194 RepID=UPI0020088935|nr:aldo/keto reductase [Epithele typhae]KAH9946005.1 aldo/keto reductase [Epithele typhae]
MITAVKIGFGDSAVAIGRIGHGLMMITWRDPNYPVPDEDAFEAIKAGVDSMPPGVKMMLNSGEFYGPNLSTANLKMLSRFYAKAANLRRSVTNINAELGGIKKMDLYEMARVPQNVPLEEAISTLAALKTEGHFQHLGMSECSAATLRKAHAILPVSIVETEVSLWSYEEETKKVLAVAKGLGIVVAAYSPLGRGFLAGSIKSGNEIPAGDIRRNYTRFNDEYVQHNLALVEALEALAAKKGVTPAQLAIAWVISRGDHVVPSPALRKNAKRNLENLAAAEIKLTDADLAEVDQILTDTPIRGGRANDAVDPKLLGLWA